MIVTRELAKSWMLADLTAIGASVEHTFPGITLTDGQYAGLCSFSYNEGRLSRCTYLQHLSLSP